MACVAAQPQAQARAEAYRPTSAVPSVFNGNAMTTFAYDPAAHRLYAGSRDGLFWLNTDEPKPAWHGPTFKSAVVQIRFAPELRRVFFTTLDDVGYADVDALDAPHLFAHVHAGNMVYEPQQREVYVSYRAPSVTVFDGKTGATTGTIEVPGWYGILQEAIPGRVFMTLPDKPGLYVINANTHHVGSWPVEGKISTPAQMEVDPSGRYIFLSYHQNVVAIDASTATVVGRLDTVGNATMAYDPGTNLLVVLGVVQKRPPLKLMAYRVDATGLTLVSSLENPPLTASSDGTLEPTSRGFIQRGSLSWLLWAATDYLPG